MSLKETGWWDCKIKSELQRKYIDLWTLKKHFLEFTLQFPEIEEWLQCAS